MAFRERSDRRIRYGRLVGLTFLVAGFITIAVGWNGAAGQACVDCQFPYIISGGFGGLALVVLGASLLVVSGLRAERMHLQSALEERAAQAPRGETPELASTGTSPNGRVVAGRSTYHRPDCRLVKGKDDLQVMPVEQAAASGLAACRVCNPATVDQAGAST
jgi:hypothetical protein